MPIYEPDMLERIESTYQRLSDSVAAARKKISHPLTLSQKIFYGHISQSGKQEMDRNDSYLELTPDRVALQDATAQMTLLQFELAGIEKTLVPTTVHCDHLIQARVDSTEDLRKAEESNREVYTFLKSAAARYGAGFWAPGSGIIHQVVFENYAFPGGLMIGTDSHTPNAGGLGMAAIGVGGADAVDVMAGLPWGIKRPRLIGVYLTGEIGGWTSPKDVILRVAEELTVKGGTGAVIEYFGPGIRSLSATGRGTISNMGAEVGATTSIFPFDEATSRFLRATDRNAIADLAESYADELCADPEIINQRSEIFDQLIEIDLNELEPAWVGPHTPDLRHSISEIGTFAKSQNFPTTVKDALIGSCTNSSYEDLSRAASVARQATDAGIKLAIPLLVTPGSEQIRATIERDGQLEALEKAGATVLANACGPCIGQWDRQDIDENEPNIIVTSFNRNFPGRNDSNRETLAFIGSPELVVAIAFSGDLQFDPRIHTINIDGEKIGFKFNPPNGDELPINGYETGNSGYVTPPTNGHNIEVVIDPESERIQRLEPFNVWNGNDIVNLPILIKTKGKTTTDHISPAGPWLRYRGHLENISRNVYTGAHNAFTDKPGTALSMLDDAESKIDTVPNTALAYKNAGIDWIVIGDDNYGEGSSREHAAMEPRYLGGRAIIARSFARIAEANLKKQGMLPLTFSDPADYDRFGPNDRVSIIGLRHFSPKSPLKVTIDHPNGETESIEVNHTFTSEQIKWFQAGSALNMIAGNSKK